jgi:hypothetical protein
MHHGRAKFSVSNGQQVPESLEHVRSARNDERLTFSNAQTEFLVLCCIGIRRSNSQVPLTRPAP